MTVQPKIQGDDANPPEPGAGTHIRQAHGLIALTNDPALIRALEDLAGAGIDVSVVADLRSLSDELLQQAGATALIDAAALDSPVDGVVDTIMRQLPDLRLLVAGQGAEQQQLASRISSQAVFRFVHKPASPQRLKLFIDAAATRPERSSSIASATPAPTNAESLARIATAVRGKSPPMLAMAGLAAVAAIALAAWIFWPGKPTSGPADPRTTSAPAPQRSESAALIAQADRALAAGKFVASDGSSAAELYRAALKLDPASKVAGDGHERAIDKGLRSAEESLLAGRLNEASTIAEAVRLIAPDNSRLDFLNTQISREQARLNSDTSQRQASEARQAQIRAALVVMKEKLKSGALIDPPASSAVSSFREAEAIGANDPAVRSARETLVAALLTAADAELSARRPPAARRLVDAAGSVNSNSPGLDVLRRRMDEVATQLLAPAPPVSVPARVEAAPATPAPPVESAAPSPSPSPSPATAAAADKPANEIVASRTLHLLRSEAPVYPEIALEKLVSGWVELEFTVMKDGSVREITVTKSEPGNTFNAAATSALARYRYAPVMRDGVAVTQRSHMRMRFTAKDSK